MRKEKGKTNKVGVGFSEPHILSFESEQVSFQYLASHLFYSKVLNPLAKAKIN